MRDDKSRTGAALICGSVAYDTIMVFDDCFKRHILPEKVHILNISFLVPELRRDFGGCAGNVAYNLRLLGGEGRPMATVGEDFEPYAAWLRKWGVSLDHNQVADAAGITLGIVAPEGRQGMLEHAAQFAAAGIPFIFDPGQQMLMFDGDEVLSLVDQATWVTLNDYEWQLMQQKTGLTAPDLIGRVEALIVTRGARGSEIFTEGRTIEIPAAAAREVVDPTGCGDAYRAGLLHGLLLGLDWEVTGRIASLVGAIKVESRGTQNHYFTPEEFERRFSESFGRSLEPLRSSHPSLPR